MELNSGRAQRLCMKWGCCCGLKSGNYENLCNEKEQSREVKNAHWASGPKDARTTAIGKPLTVDSPYSHVQGSRVGQMLVEFGCGSRGTRDPIRNFYRMSTLSINTETES